MNVECAADSGKKTANAEGRDSEPRGVHTQTLRQGVALLDEERVIPIREDSGA